MTEFSPVGSTPKMTKAQVKRYIQEMEEKRKLAQQKIEQAKKNGDLKEQEQELKELEEKLEDLF